MQYLMSAIILIVDDIKSNRQMLEASLRNEYYNVIEASGGQEALEILNNQLVDIVLLDVMMPNIDGYRVCEIMKSSVKLKDIPIIMVTALDELENRVRGLEVGADEFIIKPINVNILLTRIKSLLRLKNMIESLRIRNNSLQLLGSKVLMFEPEYNNTKILTYVSKDSIKQSISNLSKKIGSSIVQYSDDYTNNSNILLFDLVIIEYGVDGLDTLEVLRKMKANTFLRNSTFILVLNISELKVINKALEVGFNDFIIYPIDASEFIVRVKSLLKKRIYYEDLKKDVQEYANLSVKDALTDLFNKRYLEVYISEVISQIPLDYKDVYIMLIDIDDFKQINDMYGHAAGDSVLVSISQTLKTNIRAADLLVRYGGEEFLIVLYDIQFNNLKEISQRLINVIKSQKISIYNNNTNEQVEYQVTVSIGVSKLTSKMSFQECINKADTALYCSKNNGKNQYHIYK